MINNDQRAHTHEQWETGKCALINGHIVLPDRVVVGQAVVIDDAKIVGITDRDSIGSIKVVDVKGNYVAPGLIDLHTHGARGHSFNEPSNISYSAITKENARHGVTAILATVATAPLEDLVRCLTFTHEWMKTDHRTARIVGVHLEGPYFAMEQRGAQDPRHLRVPNDGTVQSLLDHHEVMRILSYAPELPGALELTKKASALGIVPAAGHSAASDVDLATAEKLGLRHVIHLWSGQSTTRREGPWRKPGLLEASLASESLTGEIIADNRHLPPTLLRLAYRCFGPTRLCVVSDATNGAGLPDGTEFTMGGMKYEVRDGVGMLPDRTSFAGSTTLLGQMIAILVRIVGIPVADVFRMASFTPASVIGIADRKGSIAAGKDADIAIFDGEFVNQRTMVGGCWIYDGESS